MNLVKKLLKRKYNTINGLMHSLYSKTMISKLFYHTTYFAAFVPRSLLQSISCVANIQERKSFGNKIEFQMVLTYIHASSQTKVFSPVATTAFLATMKLNSSINSMK